MQESHPENRYEREEYLEQDEEEREAAGRRKSLVALLVMAVLVIAGIGGAGLPDDARHQLQRPGAAAYPGRRRAFHHALNSPTSPRRAPSTITTKITPWITSTSWPTKAR